MHVHSAEVKDFQLNRSPAIDFTSNYDMKHSSGKIQLSEMEKSRPAF